MKLLLILLIVIILYVLIVKKFSLQKHKTQFYADETYSSKANIDGTIFYHEDDFCQVEIVPNENLNRLIKEAENIVNHSDENLDRVGFTDIHVREESTIQLLDRKIQVSELKEILSELSLEFHEIVSTGIRVNEMLSENTQAYGENYNGIFFNYDDDNLVINIWILGELDDASPKFKDIMNEIGKKWSLLLMDWNSLEIIDLREPNQIENYLEKLQ